MPSMFLTAAEAAETGPVLTWWMVAVALVIAAVGGLVLRALFSGADKLEQRMKKRHDRFSR